MNRFRKLLVLSASLMAALTLSSCGGGGGALGALASAVTTSLTGMAIDGPLINSTIYITTVAPHYAAGAVTQGTITTDASGNFTNALVSLPNTSDPVYATVVDSTNSTIVLTSFLGTSSALYSAGSLSSTTLHELDITPVTTAAVAVYNAIYGGYALTPATYATLVQTYSADILAIAAGVKAVGDNYCTYTSNNTVSLAEQIAAAASLSSATAATTVTVAQVGSFLGSSCTAYLNNLQTQIQASSIFGPQLLHESGESTLITTTTTAPSYTGTFTLSGVLAETGVASTGLYITSGNNAASIINNSAVTIASTGVITSTDGTITGSLARNQLTLNITIGSNTYNLSGRVANDAQVSTGAAYLVQAAGSSNTASTPAQVLTNFNGVLVVGSATPLWNGGSYSGFASGATLGGVQCTSSGSFPLRLLTSGVLPIGVVGECVTPAVGTITPSTASVWASVAQNTFTTSSSLFYSENGNYIVTAGSTSNPASLTTTTNWAELSSSNPFILTASATYANTSISAYTAGVTGTLYYVAGSSNVVFVATTAPTTCGTAATGTCSPNGLLTLGNNELQAGSGSVVNSGSHPEVQGLGESH